MAQNKTEIISSLLLDHIQHHCTDKNLSLHLKKGKGTKITDIATTRTYLILLPIKKPLSSINVIINDFFIFSSKEIEGKNIM